MQINFHRYSMTVQPDFTLKCVTGNLVCHCGHDTNGLH